MNLDDIKSEVYQQFDYFYKEDIDRIVDAYFDSILYAAANGKHVTVKGFGRFVLYRRDPPAFPGVPSKWKIKFITAEHFRRRLQSE